MCARVVPQRPQQSRAFGKALSPAECHWILNAPVLNVPTLQYASCRQLGSALGRIAYAAPIQEHLIQANYYRDPTHLEEYAAGDLGLCALNAECAEKTMNAPPLPQTLESLTLVIALGDTVVEPSISEQFGYYVAGNNTERVEMRNAPWYSEDWFGLRALDEAGKVAFNSTPGEHVEVSVQQLVDFVLWHWR